MGQDYNIYLHAVGGMGGGGGEQTKPKQLREDGGGSNSKKTTPKAVANKIGSVIQNPDSAISMAMSTASGTISKAAGVGAGGVVLAAIIIAAKVTDKVITMYNNYAAPASGDYAFQIEYNNFKQVLNNVTHPFSTLVNSQQAYLQIKKQNAVAEQQQLLTGGTILNSENGRYL